MTMKHKSDEDADPNADLRWVGPTVQFVCGAVVGALTGFGIFNYWFDAGSGSWMYIVATALVCGTLAAILGDRFWEEWFGNYNWPF